MKDRALSTAIFIIDRADIAPENLIIFQNALETEFKNDTYVIDCEAERLKLYDLLQRTFVYNSKGNGRLAWCMVKDVFSMCLPDKTIKMKYNLFLDCLLGPTRNEMAQYIEETFAAFDSVKRKTPWELHIKNENYSQQLNVPQRSKYFKKLNLSGCGDCEQFALGIFSPVPSSPSHSYYHLKAKKGALLAIISIQRFKTEKGKLPATLGELVSVGYLRHLPLDPYGNGALTYRPRADNFTLYSVGENFKDDSGIEQDKYAETPGDIVFWPVMNYEQRMKRLEKYIDESKDANAPAIEQDKL